MNSPLLVGFLASFALIAAIGAQNAFVLRQGIRREHVLPVVAICAAADALLVAAGIAGLGALVTSHPTVLTVTRYAGAAFLFAQRPLPLEEKAAALLTDEARALLARLTPSLSIQSDWTSEALEANLKALAAEWGLGLGKLAQPLRAALTGQTTSPGIFDVLVLLGKNESLARIADQAGQ